LRPPSRGKRHAAARKEVARRWQYKAARRHGTAVAQSWIHYQDHLSYYLLEIVSRHAMPPTSVVDSTTARRRDGIRPPYCINCVQAGCVCRVGYVCWVGWVLEITMCVTCVLVDRCVWYLQLSHTQLSKTRDRTSRSELHPHFIVVLAPAGSVASSAFRHCLLASSKRAQELWSWVAPEVVAPGATPSCKMPQPLAPRVVRRP
jgi:hypothetical protein